MKKKFLSAILIIAIMLTTILPVTTFASSNPSSWAVEEVSKAKNEGLVTNSVMVDYQANITREQFCEMVVRAYEKISGENAEVGNMYFSDTSNVEILKAENLGIVTGYGNNVFGPNDLITREQIATMLVRMIDKSVSYANINVYNDNYFNDKNNISDWAISSVNFAYDKGIMQGVGNNCIDPQANTTCEQAVLLVYRTVDKYYNAEAQLDSIYELTEEHIAQDEKTFVHYTDNIILAFVEKGLTEEEKEDIANVVNGDIVAQLAGSINLLQIEIESCNLNELEELAENLMHLDSVYYASPDILIDNYLIHDNTVYKNNDISYTVDDEWWTDAIEIDRTYEQYDKYISAATVGIMEDSGLNNRHEDFEGKVSFVSEIAEMENTQIIGDHGTGVTSIITANKNNVGITGVAYKSNVIYSSIKFAESDEFTSTVRIAELIKKQADIGVNVINCSFAMYYMNEDYFNECIMNKNAVSQYDSYENYLNDQWLITDETFTPEEFNEYKSINYMPYPTYDAFRKSNDKITQCLSNITLAETCSLLENENILIVQAAGNGENNNSKYPGVNAVKSSFFAGITNNEDTRKILKRYDTSYEEYRDNILIVGATINEKNGTDYKLASWSCYGENVDICAPGSDIKTANAFGNFEISDKNGKKHTLSYFYNPSDGTSMAAPMVTGTAAVLWGIDPTLTAAKVKDYIIKGAKYKAIGVTGEDAGREYPMLNVRGAVEELLKTKAVHISVGDKDTNGRIQDATVSYGNGLSETTDIIGSCDIYLVDDNHEITISKEGYKTITVTVEDKFIGQEANPDIIWLEEKEILLEKEPTLQSEIGTFSTVVDYNGKTYSGFENGNSIHVGDRGRTAKLCIYNDYIYYYHTNIDHVFGENAKTESGDFLAIWRTDLDGNNKVCIGFGGDIFDTLTSTPILIDNKIYMSVNQYDSMPDNEQGWHTWVGNMSIGNIFESRGRYYLSTDGDESYTPQLDAKYILTGNEKYLIYDVNDPLDFDPPYNENFVIYNINTGEYSTIETLGLILGNAYILDEAVYYNAQSPSNYGNFESYKYDIQSKEHTKICDTPLTYINGNGYYVDGNSIYTINLKTLETSFVVNFNDVDYFNIENVTQENVYVSYIDQNSSMILVQINKNTQDTKIIGSYQLYQ